MVPSLTGIQNGLFSRPKTAIFIGLPGCLSTGFTVASSAGVQALSNAGRAGSAPAAGASVTAGACVAAGASVLAGAWVAAGVAGCGAHCARNRDSTVNSATNRNKRCLFIVFSSLTKL